MFFTRIDRYLLRTYLRTLIICFCSLAGIFVVFHCFNNIEELASQARIEGSFFRVFAGYYGPYLLAIFNATNAILAVLALIFTMALLRRNGELTAMLAAGLCHGRILRPMLLAAGGILIIAVINRELVMPRWQDQLGAKAQDLSGELRRAMQPCYDRMTGIQLHGKGIIVMKKQIVSPTFVVQADMPGIGEQIAAETANWMPASDDRPSGYLLRGVSRPENVDQIPSTGFGGNNYILTPMDTTWLNAGECFVVSKIDFEYLKSGSMWKKFASSKQLISRISNSSVFAGTETEVILHTRFVRPFLDVSLILIGLPLVVLRGDKNMFVVAGWGLGLIAFFFLVKTVFSAMGSSETFISPAMAAWGPLIVFGPFGYSRYCASFRT